MRWALYRKSTVFLKGGGGAPMPESADAARLPRGNT